MVDLPGVTRLKPADLAGDLRDSEAGAEVEAVRGIVTAEVEAFVSARRQANIMPMVAALRSMATSVVESEMARLEHRLPDLDAQVPARFLSTALRRVTDKLDMQPTIRAKEVGHRDAVSYAAALAEAASRSTPRPSTRSPARSSPSPTRRA